MKRLIPTLGIAAALLAAAPAAAQASPALTIFMGRAIQAQTADTKCTIPTTSVDLATTASYLSSYGLRATAIATPSEIGDTTETCSSRLLYATWPELATLRDTYGWDVTPRGADNNVITGETGQQLYDDTCGVLSTMYAHGYPNAWGLYSYPQNRMDATDEAEVSTCYGYGRRYSGIGKNGANLMPITNPALARVVSVNGGQCNDSTLPCYSDPLVRNTRRYMLPSQLDATVSTADNGWTGVQFYRLVTGTQGTATTAAGLPAWDCSSPDPAQHWSHLPEEYCYTDFQAFIQGLPSGVMDESPAEVARAYGRDMGTVTTP